MQDLPRTLSEYFDVARARLAPGTAAYFLNGAGAELTLHRNRSDLEAIQVLPRVLRDLRGGNTALKLCDRNFAHPILVAPMAYQTLLDPEGESACAAAATAQDTCMVLSAQAAQPMDRVRAAGPECRWFQLYWQASRTATMTLVQRAADAGFEVLILTVDAPVSGVRDGEITAGFALPEGVGPVNLQGLPIPRFVPLGDGESALFDRIAHILPNWEDVAWLCANAPLPVILKGILAPQDAMLAVQAGAAGVIVSNHGGRVLDGAPSAISMLPGVVAQVNGAVPVLMDGGVRRGVDVFRALALGARAVLVGRPVACGLAVGGALGASHVLRLLREELEVAMALSGCRRLDDITPDRVIPPAPLSPAGSGNSVE
ncbi:alpha-hydroxy acid oxidase [Puniceibacterium confluentis]|uniref:alpha-hydroxy acid oxidase n=1 Tax=Puniceibacterium confluentis TaxID=1958944 RepID=UPI0011B73629|nr:alpha-hydroxy acid oxidase [Puniceibacterium confluentis]